jgi:hypothetical protein
MFKYKQFYVFVLVGDLTKCRNIRFGNISQLPFSPFRTLHLLLLRRYRVLFLVPMG